jgi:hypothetical protein
MARVMQRIAEQAQGNPEAREAFRSLDETKYLEWRFREASRKLAG